MRSEPAPLADDDGVRIAEIVFPNHANHLGTLFGGQALAWMDKAAFLAASRRAGGTVVTARSERIDFLAPVRQGDLVELLACVIGAGRSSLRVRVELWVEQLGDRGRTLCTAGELVMIAVDSDGRARAHGVVLAGTGG